MSFLTRELRERLEEIGEPELADDPKVIAVFQSPLVDVTFYILGYNKQEDAFFGYIEGEGTDGFGIFSRHKIDMLHEAMQNMPNEAQKHVMLIGEPHISELLPEVKKHITIARLDRLVQQHELSKQQDKGRDTGKEL